MRRLPLALLLLTPQLAVAQLPYVMPSDLAPIAAKIPTVTIARTATPISVPMASVSVLSASLLPAATVSVPGVAVGDFVQAAFSGTPPAGLTITGAMATAANTVVVSFATTGALTLASGPQNLQFCWTR